MLRCARNDEAMFRKDPSLRGAEGDAAIQTPLDCFAMTVKEVGDFCCPASPVPLESPSVARWGPTAL